MFVGVVLVVTFRTKLLAPNGMVTEAGNGSMVGLPLTKLITAPTGGAAPERVIFNCVTRPPLREVGVNPILSRTADFTVKVADFATPL